VYMICSQFGHPNGPSQVYAKNCEKFGAGVIDRGIRRCSKCRALCMKQDGKSFTAAKTISKVISRRAKKLESMLEFIDRETVYENDIKSAKHIISGKTEENSTEQGMILLEKVRCTIKFYDRMSTSKESDNETAIPTLDSPEKFMKFAFDELKKNPSIVSKNLLLSLVFAASAKATGNHNIGYNAIILNFFLSLDATTRKGCDLVAANLLGPCKRTLQRIAAKNKEPSFLNEGKEFLCDSLKTYVRTEVSPHQAEDNQFAIRKKHKNVICVCIDATAVAPKFQIDTRHAAIVGGVYPETFQSINDRSKDEINAMLLETVGTKKADEVKVAVVTQQQSIPGFPRHLILAGRAQTKNARSNFNEKIVDTCLSFAKTTDSVELGAVAVDGVSCDNDFVFENMFASLLLRSFFCERYQYIGGSNIVSFGGILLNPDLLRRAGVAKELFYINDFASDALVAKLASKETLLW